MRLSNQEDSPMYVPNWLIALELGFGALLLYLSSTALMNVDSGVSFISDSRSGVTARQVEKADADKLMLSSQSLGLEVH